MLPGTETLLSLYDAMKHCSICSAVLAGRHRSELTVEPSFVLVFYSVMRTLYTPGITRGRSFTYSLQLATASVDEIMVKSSLSQLYVVL